MPTMLELGRRYGGLAWVCERDFEVTGAWARTAAEPAWQTALADHCHRFAFHAGRLRWLVPEIAGLAVADQVVAPPDLVALAPTAAPGAQAEAVRSQWLALAAAYRQLLAAANPVSDGPAIRWLALLATDAESSALTLTTTG